MIRPTTRIILWTFLALLTLIFLIELAAQQRAHQQAANEVLPGVVMAVVLADPGVTHVTTKDVLQANATVLMLDPAYYAKTKTKPGSDETALPTPTTPVDAAQAATQTPTTRPAELYIFNDLLSLEKEDRDGDNKIDGHDPIYRYLKLATIFPGRRAIVYQSLEAAGVSAIILNHEYARQERELGLVIIPNLSAGYAVMADSSRRQLDIVPIRLNYLQNMQLQSLR
jgi:hypothetical protein